MSFFHKIFILVIFKLKSLFQKDHGAIVNLSSSSSPASPKENKLSSEEGIQMLQGCASADLVLTEVHDKTDATQNKFSSSVS